MKAVHWAIPARSQLRAIDKENAMQILRALTRYADRREGDVKALKGKHEGKLRLRVGAYRVIFRETDGATNVLAVCHRSEAYR